MNTWAAAFAVLMVVIALLHVAARLWPKRAGYHYLRRHLSRRGIDTMQIPPECIRAFVDDAHDHAHIACAPDLPARPGVGRIPHFEFERTLRVQSIVIHAIMTGKAGDTQATSLSTDSWDRYRAILCRYDLSIPTSGIAAAELSQPH